MMKNFRKKLDKHLIKALTVSFAVIFVVSGTLAYMTAKDSVSNSFSGKSQGGEVKIGEYFPDKDIFFDPDKETVGEEKVKKIWVYNTTNTDVFARVKLSAMAHYYYEKDTEFIDEDDPTEFDYSHVKDAEPYIEVRFKWVNEENTTKFKIYLDNTGKWYCDTKTGYFYYKDDLEGSATEKIYSNNTYHYNGSYESMDSESRTVPLVKSVQLSEYDSRHPGLTGFSLTAEMDYVSVTEDAQGKEQMETKPDGWLAPANITYDKNEIASIQWEGEA